ncbi:MAG: VTC domain-containing protein, partial [Clostridia bacterium]|nr:VTC domain-containing protein [Clostridia bacterium]
MAIQTFKRYEKKYLMAASDLPSLIAALSPYMDHDPYCIDGNAYIIHNVYYDTDNFHVIRASNMKPVYKEKLRLRSYYDNLSDEDTVFLELKKKIGGIVNKRRIGLKIREIDSFISNPTLIDCITED